MTGFPRRHPVKVLALALYVALLVPSNMVTMKPRLDPRKERVEVPVMGDGGAVEGGATTRMPYLHWGPEGDARGVVILLHGSPGDANNFAPGPGFGTVSPGLGPELAGLGWDAFALDLPGMGDHFDDVPTRSSLAHAHAVLAFMDAKGIERAHVVGWSQGGAVVLYAADLAPRRVESLTLLAAVGAQETEGSGDYWFEHAKYGLGVAAAYALEWGVPHFGSLDGTVRQLRVSMLNFWDSDQRPLERVLRETPVPVLILHGRGDFLVSPWAAERHHEMRPEAALVMLNDADHFMPFLKAPETAGRLSAFFGDPVGFDDYVEEVTPSFGVVGERVARALHLAAWPVVAVVVGVCAFVAPVWAAAVFGMLVATLHADIGVVLVGLFLGHGARQVWRGGKLGPVVGVAVVGMAASAGVAGLVMKVEGAGRSLWWLWVLGVGLVAFAAYVLPNLVKRRGRRGMVARFGRLVRYEFWPPVVFYLPLVPWVLWLAVKHRGLWVWTCCNPGISRLGGVGGGIVGESKSRIQAAFGGREGVAATVLVEAGDEKERFEAALRAAEEVGGGFPVILKPDAGERGFAVRLAQGVSDVQRYVEDFAGPFVVQAYHAGPCECGVFVVKRPGSEGHEVFSVTRKTFPIVVGDGASTLLELIWKHPRYRLQAGVFEKRWKERLSEVLAEGEELRLAESGNHSQGCVFSDGSELVTPEMERVFAEIAASFDAEGEGEGVDFGRFDVRYESDEKLKRGEGFSIVEFNGVTAESTNLYDPSSGVLRAYGVLFEQWRVAFEIGAANRGRGVRPVGVVELLRAVWKSRVGRVGGRGSVVSS